MSTARSSSSYTIQRVSADASHAVASEHKIHLCEQCSDESWQDVDSECYESFGLLHEIKVRKRHHQNKQDPSASSTTVVKRKTFHNDLQEEHKGEKTTASLGKSHNATPSSWYPDAFLRASSCHDMAIEQGWIKQNDPMAFKEVMPTCEGAHRRVAMVQKLRALTGGALLCRLLFITERRVLNRPLLRGKVHLYFSILSPIWLTQCIFKDTRHPLASCLTGGSILCCSLFSATLHHKSPRCLSVYKRLREMDHIGIFLQCNLSTMLLIAHRGTQNEYLAYLILQITLFTVGALWILKFGFMKAHALTRVAVYILYGFTQLGLLKTVLQTADLYVMSPMFSFVV
eukprot:GHVH01004958.1.p1 GENE.GHVH01004958.1~~GHVH01004958.1.p1  ORF type:complete len:343 (+),score=32.37 GHVH01004958.1:130-1158(+)